MKCSECNTYIQSRALKCRACSWPTDLPGPNIHSLAYAGEISCTRRWATDYIEQGYRLTEAKLAEEVSPVTVIKNRAVKASR